MRPLIAALALLLLAAPAAAATYPTGPPAQLPMTNTGDSASAGNLNVACAAATLSCPPASVVGLYIVASSGVKIQVAGTFTGTMTVECSLDGVNWTASTVYPDPLTGATVGVTTITAPGQFDGNVSGCTYFQVRMGTFVSGTAAVIIHATEAAGVARSTSAASGGATGLVTPSKIFQTAANAFAGTCTMAAATTCTANFTATFANPICQATAQGLTAAAGAVVCSITGQTITLTAAVPTSETFAYFISGNPN